MKKVLIKGGYLAAGLLMASTCIANPIGHSEVISHCRYVSHELMRLASWNNTAPCVGKVESSARYIEQAANGVQKDQIPYALGQLNFAVKTLNELSTQTECIYFAIKTKPHLMQLERLSTEVESLDHYPQIRK